MVGKHRRIPNDAVVKYRSKMFRQAGAADDEMTQLAQDSGIYESEGPSTDVR
jgi:hypothetical protein